MNTRPPTYLKYSQAPQRVRDFLISDEIQTLLDEIAHTRKLSDEDREILYAEIEDLFVGMTKPEQFVSRLAGNLAVSNELAAELAKEINTKLLAPYRDDLLLVHGVNPAQLTLQQDHTTLPSTKQGPVPSLGMSAQSPAPGLSARMEQEASPFAPTTPRPVTPPSPAAVPQVKTAQPPPDPLEAKLGSAFAVPPATTNVAEAPRPQSPRPADPYRESTN